MRVENDLNRGILIAIEGIDGAGKTTQAATLYQYLRDRGYRVLLLHEPTNSIFGRKIKESAVNGRHDPYEELNYFIEDRRYDVAKNIEPALREKSIVIMDRYYFSTIAYQGARGIDLDQIKAMNEKISPKPDLTIVLDVAPNIGLSRIKQRGNSTPNHFERKTYLTKVQEIFKSMKDPSIQIIDGARNTHEIADEILNMTLNILKPIERVAIEID